MLLKLQFAIITLLLISPEVFSGDKVNLSVASFNMWRKDNYDRIPSAASKFNNAKTKPDIILLQEAIAYKKSNTRSTAHNLASLMSYQTIFYTRPNDKEGLGIITKLKILKHSFIELTKSRKEKYRRILLIVDLLHPKLKLIRVYNLHLAHKSSDHEGRAGQVTDIFEAINENERLDPADITILGGDFNATPNDPTMAKVESLWKEQFELTNFTNPNSSHPTWANVKRDGHFVKGKRLDHLFLFSKKVHTFLGEQRFFQKKEPSTERVFRKYFKDFIWVSDHQALIHTYSFKQI